MANRNGIIVTEEGVSVSRAPDYKQVLNSGWPLLEIAFEQVYTSSLDIPATGVDKEYTYLIMKHNLGFVPAFTWMDAQEFDGYVNGYPMNDPFFNRYTIQADETSVYVRTAVAAAHTPISWTVRGKLFVYNYDPAQEFQAESLGSSDVGLQKSKYGMIALKDGAKGKIDDVEYSKFSTHTRAKSLQVHKSGIMKADDSSNFTGTINHKLGYLPSYMIFSYNGTALTPGIPARTYGDGENLNFVGVQAVLTGKWAYIIFKDPLLEQV